MIEHIVDDELPFNQFLLRVFVLALDLVAEENGEILGIGVETWEKIKYRSLFFFGEDVALLHIMIHRWVGQPNGHHIGCKLLPFFEKGLQTLDLDISNVHCF